MTRSKDRAVEHAWRLTLGLMIFGAASSAVMLVYAAFFAGLAAQWMPMSIYLAAGTSIGWGVYWLCMNRNDLVGVQ